VIDAAAAETRATVSMISPEAIKLADQLGGIAGIDPDPMACPPGWCGAAMQVQSWLNAGWPADAIVVGARTAMARKRDGPPTTAAYFTKPIAQAVAGFARPLPEVSHAEPRKATTGQPRKSMLDVFAELAAQHEQENCGEPRPPVDRLLSNRKLC
jgi:hypothetical protein